MDKLFLAILNMSLMGAFVIAAICLARLPLKKAPKIISYCLWAVAGFRLVFPFSIESVFSLIPFKAQTIPPDIAIQPVPRIDSGISIVNNAISSVLPAAPPAASVNPLQIWIIIGAFVWLVGAFVLLIYGVVSFVVLRQKMKHASHIETNIYETPNIKSPFVLGVFKPKIYLPIGLSGQERSYILLHEQTHIRRCDHMVKLVAYFVLCLHWFNPMVWLAFLLMGVDMEMSCDERVLKEIGSEVKKAYSMSLLSLATERRIIGGSPLAFGEGSIKERIKNVLNFKKPSRKVVIITVALAAVLSIGFLVNRPTDRNNLDSITPRSMNDVVNEPHFAGTVIEVHDNTILVRVNEGEDARRSSDLISVSLNVKLKDSVTHFTVGDKVIVYYNGEIAESYPAQVNTVYGIVLTSPDMSVNMEDIDRLSTMGTPYVGDNSAVGNIVNALPRINREYTQQFFSIGDDYGTGRTPYTLTVYYEPDNPEAGDAGTITVTPKNAVLLFMLIDNLEEVNYAFRSTPSGGEMDKAAYNTIAVYSRKDVSEYLETIGLEWEDFKNDWKGSVEKMYAAPSPVSYQSQDITIEDVRALAKNGNSLLFEDFQKYNGVNTSSRTDYNIMVYSVEGGYRLIVHSNESGTLDMVNLESIWESRGSGIDIRYGDMDEFLSKRPIVMLVKGGIATPLGTTVTLKNVTDSEYIYGESYTIQRKDDGGWIDVEPIIENYGFNSIGYMLPAMESKEMAIDWEWLYGKISPGDYRIVKDALLVRSPGDYDTFTLYAAFTVAGEN
ncbi:M56 family metallopeptidase [Lacrimispora sp.]|uniref:M56 family metallopeptidase n=1 Tax=Lacrimispora sp. TaxID=2719234 RepID=UPI00345F6B0C